MKGRRTDDQYGPKEAEARMKAALLGARIAGHVPMKAKKAKKTPKKSRVKK